MVREGVGDGGEMTQTLYAYMNKKKKDVQEYMRGIYHKKSGR
jgi:hypothetical protein